MSEIKKLHVHGVPVLPEIYGESLSYMEIQGKLQKDINTMYENQVEFDERLKSAEDDIDSLETNVSSLGSDIDSLDSRLSTAEGDIDSLETRMGTTEGDIDSLETRMGTAEGDIDSLETRMNTAEGDIDSLETRMGTAEGDIDSLETRMGTAEGDIDSLETRMGTAEGDIDSLETRMGTAEGDIDALETRVGTAEGDIDSLETRMDTAEGDIDDAEQDISDLDSRVTALEESAGADTSYKANVIHVSDHIGGGEYLTIAQFFINNSEVSDVEISGTVNFSYEMLNSATIASYTVLIKDGSTLKEQFYQTIVDDGSSGTKYEYFNFDYVIENVSAGNHEFSITLGTSNNLAIN